MLEGIFGNRAAERALLHIYHYGEIHASAIAKDYRTSLTAIRGQLDRFERAGILIAKTIGRSRIYSFNPKSSLMPPVRELIRIVYESIPLKERERLFGERRRPRAKGKPIL